MRLSTKARYAMRLMVELALHQKNGPVLLKDIARRQEISARYLEQLILDLKAAGLVKSIRGAKGGFLLARPPKEITLLEIFQASEGPILLMECLENDTICRRSPFCACRELWQEMRDTLKGVLNRYSLTDLSGKERKKPEEKGQAMYYI